MVPNPFAKTTIIENGHYQSIVVRLATATAVVLQKRIRPGKRILVCPGNIVPKNSVLISFAARLSPEGGIVENYTPMDINLLWSSSKIVLGYAEHHVFAAQTSTATNLFTEMRATVQMKEAVRKLGDMFSGVRIQPQDVDD